MLSTFEDQAAGTRAFGQYELLEEIGRGGMGVVWRARQKSLNRLVALKMILRGDLAREEELRRFRVEAESAARLQHPNIVRIHEIGEVDGQPYFAMDYVDGTGLDQIIRDQPLPAKRAAEYVRRIAEAVHYAHTQGIVHRDLKPSNILIDQHDEPRVTDFGVAKQLDANSDLTVTGQLLGSPNYMAPEQAAEKGQKIAPTTDVYALGAMLYHLVTGRPPFHGHSVAETLHQLQTATPASLRLVNATTPLDLETICLKCLEKDPARRYATAKDLASDLGLFLENKPIRARRAGGAEKFWRWCRRNPVAAGLTAWLLITLLAGPLTILQSARRETQRERKRRTEAQIAQANETQLRKEAQATSTQLADALNKLQLERAENFFVKGDSSAALAEFGRLLRQNRSNYVASERILSALMQRHFALPSLEPIKHEQAVYAAMFSPDGQRLVTISGNQAHVWNARAGAPIGRPLIHETDLITASFSPDGMRIVTACTRGDVSPSYARVWEVETGVPVTPPLNHRADMTCAQFSPDGLLVLTASADGTARIWDADTGELKVEPLRHGDRVVSAVFSSNGLQVVTASWDQLARIWDAKTGKLIREIEGANAPLSYAEFSPDGRRVVIATGDQFVLGNTTSSRNPDEKVIWNARVWDADSGEALTGFLQHRGPILTARFSPDGERIISAAHDKTVSIWDARSGQLLAEPLRHDSVFVSIHLSRDGERLVTASGNTARIWNARTGQALTEPIRHEGSVRSAEFDPSDDRVVTASADKTARIWDIKNPRKTAGSLKHSSIVTSAEFSPDAKWILTASYDSTSRIWNAQTGQAVLELPDSFWYARFSPDGQRVVTAGKTASARVWNTKTGEPVAVPLEHEKNINYAEFSPDGSRVVTASQDGSARVWTADTGHAITEPLRHDGVVWSARFRPDGSSIVTASLDGTARVWDSITGREQFPPLKHGQSVLSARFSPDGDRIVTASHDKTARVWDAQTGQPLTPSLKHEDYVLSAEFSPDSSRVLTASNDRTARVWDSETGKPVTPSFEHEAGLRFARFSPQGKRVVTTSWDKTARVWDVETGLPLSEWLQHPMAVAGAEFSADGERLLTVCWDHVQFWEVPHAPLPVPEWLPRLIEAIAQRRIDDAGFSEIVPFTELQVLRIELAHESGNDVWIRCARSILSRFDRL